MKLKKKKLLESIVNRRAKLLENHVLGLGVLPSSKLMKMKWNPITGKTLKEQDAPIAAPAAESPTENDIIGDLRNALANWEDKEHPYYTDIEGILNKYTGA